MSKTAHLSTPGPSLSILVGWFALCLCSGVALAQDDRPEEGASNSQEAQSGGPGDNLSAQAQALLTADLKLGPFRLQPQFGASNGWQTVPRAQGVTGELESDYNVRARPGLAVVLPFQGNHQVRGNVGLEYVWFREFDELSALNGNGNISYSFAGNRASFTVSETYDNRERNRFSRVRDGELLPDQALEIDDNQRIVTNVAEGEFEFRTTDRLTLGAEARSVRNRFEDDERLAAAANGRAIRIGTSARYGITRNLSVGAVYRRQDFNTDVPDSTRESVTDNIGLELEWESEGPVSGRTNFSHTRLTPETDAEGFSGVTFSGRISLRPSELVAFDLEASRDLFLSAFRDNLFAVRTGGSVATRLALTDAVIVDLDASYFVADYPLADILDPEAAAPRRREDTVTIYGATADWTVTRTTGVLFRLGYFQRDTPLRGLKQDGLTASAGLSFRY